MMGGKKDSQVDSTRIVCMMTLWIAGLAVAAQVSSFAAQVSSFEVASVKPVNPPAGPHVVSLIINHGSLNIEAAELRQIVGLAYSFSASAFWAAQDGPIPTNSISPLRLRAPTRRGTRSGVCCRRSWRSGLSWLCIARRRKSPHILWSSQRAGPN